MIAVLDVLAVPHLFPLRTGGTPTQPGTIDILDVLAVPHLFPLSVPATPPVPSATPISAIVYGMALPTPTIRGSASPPVTIYGR